MKSTIKVDYKSRYGDGDFGDKEPIIRVDLVESDDPRDTLIHEIFRDEDFARIAGVERGPSSKNPQKQYVIFRRGDRERQINDFMSPIFSGLIRYTGIEAEFITSSDELYFALAKDNKIRSKGINDKELSEIKYGNFSTHMKDVVFIDRVVEEWKDFEKIVEKSK